MATMSKSDKLQRVRYFAGQILGADDFNTEQNYFIQKHRLHNRHLHGWGVVNGLDVTVDKSNVVHVSPGVAIDCVGNELLLYSPQELAAPPKPGEFFVVVEYFETELDPVPAPSTEGSTDSAVMNSRAEEGCRVYIANTDPNLKHDGIGPGTAGCGLPHPISIAQLQKKEKSWKVTKRGRR
jgi:hypothetical protein